VSSFPGVGGNRSPLPHWEDGEGMDKKPFKYCFKKLMSHRGSIKNFKEFQALSERDKQLLENILKTFKVEEIEEVYTEELIKWI
jgi:hypothetical protein